MIRLFLPGGDCKTLMVVQLSPAMKNINETICSLTFAERVRMVELGQAQKKMDGFESPQIKVYNKSADMET